jgi:hypothetical protein
MKTGLSNIEFRSIVGGSSSFDDAIDRLMRDGGVTKGRAILLARKYNPEVYNSWMKKRWQTDCGRLTQTL